MNPEEIEQALQVLNLHKVKVSTDGSHAKVIAVDDKFSQMSKVKSQQLIYQPLMAYIQSNVIHALTIKTYTVLEWERQQKLGM